LEIPESASGCGGVDWRRIALYQLDMACIAMAIALERYIARGLHVAGVEG